MWLKSFTNIVEYQQNLESRFNQVAANVLWPVLLLSNLQKAIYRAFTKIVWDKVMSIQRFLKCFINIHLNHVAEEISWRWCSKVKAKPDNNTLYPSIPAFSIEDGAPVQKDDLHVPEIRDAI